MHNGDRYSEHILIGTEHMRPRFNHIGEGALLATSEEEVNWIRQVHVVDDGALELTHVEAMNVIKGFFFFSV